MDTFKEKVSIGTYLAAKAIGGRGKSSSTLKLEVTLEDGAYYKEGSCVRVNKKHKIEKGLYLLKVVGYGKEYGEIVYDCDIIAKWRCPSSYYKEWEKKYEMPISTRTKHELLELENEWIDETFPLLNLLVKKSEIGYSESEVYAVSYARYAKLKEENANKMLKELICTKNLNCIKYEYIDWETADAMREKELRKRAEERKAKKEAERKAKKEVERKAKEEAEKKAAEEAKKNWSMDDWKAALAAKYNKR